MTQIASRSTSKLVKKSLTRYISTSEISKCKGQELNHVCTFIYLSKSHNRGSSIVEHRLYLIWKDTVGTYYKCTQPKRYTLDTRTFTAICHKKLATSPLGYTCGSASFIILPPFTPHERVLDPLKGR